METQRKRKYESLRGGGGWRKEGVNGKRRDERGEERQQRWSGGKMCT